MCESYSKICHEYRSMTHNFDESVYSVCKLSIKSNIGELLKYHTKWSWGYKAITSAF